jgi:hypothetical protein
MFWSNFSEAILIEKCKKTKVECIDRLQEESENEKAGAAVNDWGCVRESPMGCRMMFDH